MGYYWGTRPCAQASDCACSKFGAGIAAQEPPAPAGVGFELHLHSHGDNVLQAHHRCRVCHGPVRGCTCAATHDDNGRDSAIFSPDRETIQCNHRNKLLKQNLYDPSDSKIGEIVDILVGNDGRIDAFIISVGGFLGMDWKDVAILFGAVRATNKNGKWYLTMNATKDALKAAPGYKYDKAKANWVPA
jgi:PRC-barrel domain